MLTRVHIQNFRACREVLLENLGQITALVGRNGAGKTSVMRAVEMGAQNAVGDKLTDNGSLHRMLLKAEQCRTVYDIEIGSKFRYAQSLRPHFIKQEKKDVFGGLTCLDSLSQLQGDRWHPIFERDGEKIQVVGRPEELQIGAAASSFSALASLLPQDDPVLQLIKPVAAFLGAIRYYPLDERNIVLQSDGAGVIRHQEYEQWFLEHSRFLNPNSPVLMRLIHMAQHDTQHFDEVKSLMGPEGLGLLGDIDVQTIKLPLPQQKAVSDKSDAFYIVRFMPILSSDGWRSYVDLSFGTRRLLRILVSLLFDRSALMLVEQPEDGIHPGLLHKLMPLLKQYADTSQFIIASHSPTVFNRLQPQEIRLVHFARGETKVRSLTQDEIEGAERFISEDGPLSDFIETIQDTE